jgi:hypothetical protein
MAIWGIVLLQAIGLIVVEIQPLTSSQNSIPSGVSNGQHILVNQPILPIPKATLPLVIFNSHWLLPAAI